MIPLSQTSNEYSLLPFQKGEGRNVSLQWSKSSSPCLADSPDMLTPLTPLYAHPGWSPAAFQPSQKKYTNVYILQKSFKTFAISKSQPVALANLPSCLLIGN